MQELTVCLGSFAGAGVLILLALWRIQWCVAVENDQYRQSAASARHALGSSPSDALDGWL